MKKITCVFLSMSMIASMPALCAADSIGLGGSTGCEIWVTYEEGKSNIYKTQIDDGRGTITLSDKTVITVSNVMDTPLTLAVFPVPDTDAEARSWMQEHLGSKTGDFYPYLIYFLDENGKQVNVTGARVTIESGYTLGKIGVFYLNSNGRAGEITTEASDTGVAFVLGGYDYYILAEKSTIEIPTPPPDPWIPPSTPTPTPLPDNYPEGSEVKPDGTIETPDGVQVKPDGTIILPDGDNTELKPDEQGNKPTIDKDGTVTDTNGTQIQKDGVIILPGPDKVSPEDDVIVGKGVGALPPKYNPKDGSVTLRKGNIVIYLVAGGTEMPRLMRSSGLLRADADSGRMIFTPPENSVVTRDGIITEPDGTIVTPDGVTHRTDGAEIAYNGTVQKPATPKWETVAVSGNKGSVILSEEAFGAKGYDYVISKNKDCIVDKDYLQVNKNQLLTRTDFTYIQKGTYYAYCHAWIRGADGKKVFSGWSDAYKFVVKETTPKSPVIRSVKKTGKNSITITVAKGTASKGYDIVLGKQVRKVKGEQRPVNYGTYVKKNQKSSTITFKNLKKGTYYISAHSFNRGADNKKVFSPWGNIRKIVIK